jgi:hypothetical protein
MKALFPANLMLGDKDHPKLTPISLLTFLKKLRFKILRLAANKSTCLGQCTCLFSAFQQQKMDQACIPMSQEKLKIKWEGVPCIEGKENVASTCWIRIA